MNVPQIPVEIAEQARQAGGGWLYEVVGRHDPRHEVPPSAIKGSWKLDANGELTGEYVSNPGFQPDGARSGGCPVHAPRR